MLLRQYVISDIPSWLAIYLGYRHPCNNMLPGFSMSNMTVKIISSKNKKMAASSYHIARIKLSRREMCASLELGWNTALV